MDESLWTLWWELMAYTVVLAAGMSRLLTPRGVAGVAAWCWLASLANMVLGSESSAANTHWNTAIPRLGLMFACGALLWLHRSRVPVRPSLLVVALAVIVGASFVPNYRLLAAPAVAVCVCRLRRLPRTVGAAAAEARPVLRHLRLRRPGAARAHRSRVRRSLVVSFTAVTLAIVVPLAAASWLLVERPAVRWVRRRRESAGGHVRRRGPGLTCPRALSVAPVTVRDMTTRIDCDTCVVRGLHCHDCVVTVLLGPPPELTIDDDEMAALDALASGGLVPPLRLVGARCWAGDRVRRDTIPPQVGPKIGEAPPVGLGCGLTSVAVGHQARADVAPSRGPHPCTTRGRRAGEPHFPLG